MASPTLVADAFLGVAFAARHLAHVMGAEEVDASKVLRALSVAFAARFLTRTSLGWKRLIPMLLVLLTTPRFRLGLGRPDADEVTPAEHLLRLAVFRKVDLKLPPRRTVFQLARDLVMNPGVGMWQRHKFEYNVFKATNSKVFSALAPLQLYDPTKPATMFAFCCDPADVEQILTDRETFPTRGKTGFTEIVGEGLLGMESGAKHSAHRRLVLQFLSEKHLEEYSETISDQIKVLLDKWGVSSTSPEPYKPKRFDCYYDMSVLTLDCIMKIGFGAPDKYMSQHVPNEENDLAHALDVVLKDIVIRTAIPFISWLPIPRQFYIRRMKAKADDLQRELFEASLESIEKNPNAPRTMLSEMLRMRRDKDKDAQGLTDSEIADELQTIRGAGHETTSNTLCWTLMLLAQNPHELAALREEADSVIQGEVCTFAETKQLHKHHCAVLEALRLNPTVPSYPRECHKDVKLVGTGVDIPAGSIVFVSQRALNRIGWDRPDDFVPSRFESVKAVQMGMPVGNPATGNRYQFAPFGAANRSCVGQRIAMAEAVQILGTLVKNMEWKLMADGPIPEVADITLGPKESMWLEVKRRVKA